MKYTNRPTPKTPTERRAPNNRPWVREEVRAAHGSIAHHEARAIAEELKAKGLIWFTPPDPVAIAKAIHHKPLVHRIAVASRSPRPRQRGGNRT